MDRQDPSPASGTSFDSAALIHTVPIAVWAIDRFGTPLFFNRHYLQFVGLTHQAALEAGLEQAAHPDDLQAFRALLDSLKDECSSGETEVRLRRCDGVFRWFLCGLKPWFDEVGRLIGWCGTCTDIEEHKKVEAHLRRSEAFLAQGQRLTATGSTWWDVKGDEIIWSEETYRQMGYPPTTLPTVAMAMDRIHPEDAERVVEALVRNSAEGNDIDMEHRLLLPDGTVTYCRIVLQNRESKEHPVYIGAMANITSWKEAEMRSRRSALLLEAGERIGKTGTFSWLIDTEELTVSEEFRRIFELEPDEAVTAEKCLARVHVDDRNIFFEKRARTLAGLANAEHDLRLRIADGSLRYIRVINQVELRHDGMRECLGAVQDVTRQRHAEDALDRLRSELARMTGVMSVAEMAASIAHEVNQPLAGMIANASTAMRSLSSAAPNVEEALDASKRGLRDATRGAEVLGRLCHVRKEPLHVGSFDLNGALSEVLMLFEAEMRRESIELQAELECHLPAVNGDRLKLQQVAMNFVRNAIEALGFVSDRPKRIEVRTRQVNEDVEVLVTDNGRNLKDDEQLRAFDPYATRPSIVGRGLYLSKMIIEEHSGRIFVANVAQQGKTFGFSIPTRLDPAP